MRPFIVLILLSSFLIESKAQNPGNFKAKGPDIVWQKTYAIFDSNDEAKARFKKLKLIASDMQENGNEITGKTVIIMPDISGAGFTPDVLEDWIVRKDIVATVTAVFDNGAYTVTFSDIWMRQRESTRKENEGMMLRLREFVYDAKKAEWNKNFVEKGGATVLDYTLEKAVNLNKASINRDF